MAAQSLDLSALLTAASPLITAYNPGAGAFLPLAQQLLKQPGARQPVKRPAMTAAQRQRAMQLRTVKPGDAVGPATKEPSWKKNLPWIIGGTVVTGGIIAAVVMNGRKKGRRR